MPSPKPVRTAAVPANSTSATPRADVAGAAIAVPASDLDGLSSSSTPAQSGRPRRRSSLLKNNNGSAGSGGSSGSGGRLRASSTAAMGPGPASSRLQPRGDDGNVDGWDDAWGNTDDNGGGGGDDVFTKDDGSDSGIRDERRGGARRRGEEDQILLDDDYLHDDEETGLTAAARQQRTDARQQRTRLDQRFVESEQGAATAAGDGGDDGLQSYLILAALTEAERKEADQHVLRRVLIDVSLIVLWYIFSLSLSLYNKWMFGSNFPFPLFTTSIHMLVQFLLACLVLYFVPSLRPGRRQSGHGHGHGHSHDHSATRQGGDDDDDADDDDNDGFKPARRNRSSSSASSSSSATDDGGPAMTKWFYLTRIGPCGAATGLDIGLGNASLKLITLTFYTMCKSSSLAFVLLFAIAFRLERPTVQLVSIIAAMTGGVIMMVAGEVEFDTIGFVLVISAAFFSGFRWGLTQIMLLRNPATSNPFSSIFYLAPVMFVTLFVLAIPMEGFPALVQGFRELADKFGALRAPLLVLFPGTIAFLMTASEFALLQRTSVVTLSIAGIFKEVVTITTATLVFHDTLTFVNLVGLVITMVTIVSYNIIKITKMRHRAQIDVHKGHQQQLQLLQQNQQEGDEDGGEGPSPSGSASQPTPTLPTATTAPRTAAASAHHHGSDAEGDDDDGEDAGLLGKPDRQGR